MQAEQGSQERKGYASIWYIKQIKIPTSFSLGKKVWCTVSPQSWEVMRGLGKKWSELKSLHLSLLLQATKLPEGNSSDLNSHSWWCTLPGGGRSAWWEVCKRTELFSMHLDPAAPGAEQQASVDTTCRYRTCCRKFARCCLLAVTAQHQELRPVWVLFCSSKLTLQTASGVMQNSSWSRPRSAGFTTDVAIRGPGNRIFLQ